MLKRIRHLLSPKYRFRSAVTGKWVSKLYALANPTTTVAEKVK